MGRFEFSNRITTIRFIAASVLGADPLLARHSFGNGVRLTKSRLCLALVFVLLLEAVRVQGFVFVFACLFGCGPQ
jgi:hypothetical protein